MGLFVRVNSTVFLTFLKYVTLIAEIFVRQQCDLPYIVKLIEKRRLNFVNQLSDVPLLAIDFVWLSSCFFLNLLLLLFDFIF